MLDRQGSTALTGRLKEDFYRLLDDQKQEALEVEKSVLQQQLGAEKDSLVDEFTRQQEQLGTMLGSNPALMSYRPEVASVFGYQLLSVLVVQCKDTRKTEKTTRPNIRRK